MNSTELARRFNLPNVLRFEDAPGGLVRAVVSSQAAEAEIYLQGAHVARWKPCGQRPVLFLSSKSLFKPGKAIRGGVPVIFPWFGPRAEGKPGPAHGFARTTEWALEGTKLRNNGDVEITLVLAPNDSARAFGYGEFALRFSMPIGSNLQKDLEVHNWGKKPRFTKRRSILISRSAMFVKLPSRGSKALSTSTKPMDSNGSNWATRPFASPRKPTRSI